MSCSEISNLEMQGGPAMNNQIYVSPNTSTTGSDISNAADGNKLTLSGFEGPEKLIEIWFHLPSDANATSPLTSASVAPDIENYVGHDSESVDSLDTLNIRTRTLIADQRHIAAPASVAQVTRRDSLDHPNNTSDEEGSVGSFSDIDAPAHHYASLASRNAQGDYMFARRGLRTVDRATWEDMLQIVKCQVLSTIKNEFVDAYLLSESSMFVFTNRIVLKTCGTTTLLHAVPRILDIAKKFCGMSEIEALFYSRKAFLFPERQAWPHGKWGDEVAYLDGIFPSDQYDTSGYVVGKINGDHWCLYTCSPAGMDMDGNPLHTHMEEQEMHMIRDNPSAGLGDGICDADAINSDLGEDDVTLEILMTNLDPQAMKAFWRTEDEKAAGLLPENQNVLKQRFNTPEHRVFTETGISDVYPDSIVDDYVFDPCGYSLNGLLGPYYYTIHVTPEDICSYASFETTVPVRAFTSRQKGSRVGDESEYDTFKDVIEKVVERFKPGRFSTTLFVRHSAASKLGHGRTHLLDGVVQEFRRRDRIVHTLGQWDVIFCHFDKPASAACGSPTTTAAVTGNGGVATHVSSIALSPIAAASPIANANTTGVCASKPSMQGTQVVGAFGTMKMDPAVAKTAKVAKKEPFDLPSSPISLDEHLVAHR